MSWFRGKSKEPEPAATESSFGEDTSGFEGSTNFASGPPSQQRGGGGVADLQAAVAAVQQEAAMRATLSRLTEIAFTKCVQKPSSSLTSTEKSCIDATVFKYFDTTEFVTGRLLQSQQAGGGV